MNHSSAQKKKMDKTKISKKTPKAKQDKKKKQTTPTARRSKRNQYRWGGGQTTMHCTSSTPEY